MIHYAHPIKAVRFEACNLAIIELLNSAKVHNLVGSLHSR